MSPRVGDRGGDTDGHAIIGVDLRDTEVTADPGTSAGRASMVDDVTAACGGVLDGLVACAGIGGEHAELVTRINYFGAKATPAGLRPSSPSTVGRLWR